MRRCGAGHTILSVPNHGPLQSDISLSSGPSETQYSGQMKSSLRTSIRQMQFTHISQEVTVPSRPSCVVPSVVRRVANPLVDQHKPEPHPAGQWVSQGGQRGQYPCDPFWWQSETLELAIPSLEPVLRTVSVSISGLAEGVVRAPSVGLQE